MASMIEIRNDIDPKKYFPNAEHVVIYAFSIGARHYFRMDSHLNIPYERALSTLLFYQELDLNCDREFLLKHAQAVNAVLTSNPIDIYRIKLLNDQLLQRLELPKHPELMYKLASVVFFDQDENPAVYEWEYGQRKIGFWKESTSLADFFLQKPIVELIPYLEYAGENLETFSRMTEKASDQHLASVLANLSATAKMK